MSVLVHKAHLDEGLVLSVIVPAAAVPPRHGPASAETREGTTATKATNNEWTNMAVQGARKQRKPRRILSQVKDVAEVNMAA